MHPPDHLVPVLNATSINAAIDILDVVKGGGGGARPGRRGSAGGRRASQPAPGIEVAIAVGPYGVACPPVITSD